MVNYDQGPTQNHTFASNQGTLIYDLLDTNISETLLLSLYSIMSIFLFISFFDRKYPTAESFITFNDDRVKDV